MSESLFEIRAPGVDTEKIVAAIRETVARKMADGAYADARVARAERSNLARLHSENEFLEFYLRCLHDAVHVDINDFAIRERRRGLGPLLVLLKKTIWSLLKFYTYRLWSQQNQVNGLLVTALEGLDRKYQSRIQELENRIKELESRTGKSS